MAPSPAQILSLVERSPALVAAQDREGWLALFAGDGAVEDPVGAAPNHRDALGRFYDTFIAGNEIVFRVAQDIVAGLEVVREVVIHTRLSTGLRIEVPAFLIYEVVDEDGALRIQRMRAVWDLRRRTIDAMRAGPSGLWTLTAISLRMLRVQGVRGVLGYSRGLVHGIFGRGREVVERLAAAVGAGDTTGASALFTPGATVELVSGATGRTFAAQPWLAALGAGAALQVEKVTSAGWLTAFRFSLAGAAPARGVGFLEFDPATRKIAAARLFTASEAA